MANTHIPIVIIYVRICILGFSDDLASKESICNAGDLGLVPGLGRFPGERNVYIYVCVCVCVRARALLCLLIQSCLTLCNPFGL